MYQSELPVEDIEYKFQAKEICRKLVRGPWKGITNESIAVTRIKAGRSNRLYLCQVKGEPNSSLPKVIVRFYGSEHTGKGNRYKSVSDETEYEILKHLSSKGMAPKVLTRFDGGRVDEYLESSMATADSLKSLPVIQLAAKKIAQFHSLDIDIPERYNNYDIYRSMKRQAFEVINDFDNSVLNYQQYKLWSTVREFITKEETDLIIEEAQSIQQRIVFAHMDLNPTNFLLIKGQDDVNSDNRLKDIMVIDVENCQIGYRGMDLGKFFVELSLGDGKSRVNPVSDSLIKSFIQSYLNEWSQVSDDYVPSLDTIDNLLMEIKFGCMFSLMVHITWNVLHPNFTSTELLKDSVRRISVYRHFERLWFDWADSIDHRPRLSSI